MTPDGESFLAERVEVLRQAVAAGRRALVVFDLDNTFFDTRPRTLAAARSFDAATGASWFNRLELDGVRRDGRETARAAGLPDDQVAAFGVHWDDFFWNPEHLGLDVGMQSIVCWAHRATAAGAEVRFLTGRIAALHEASVAALQRIGLAVDGTTVMCKPDLTVRTAAFKGEVLARWAAEAVVGWFLTEGRRDVAWVQAHLPQIPCVLLDCSFEEARESEIAEGTPVLRRVF